MTATLEIVTAPELAPVRHGFFTRRGGASSGIFAGLNCGQGSSDQAAAVALNRSRAATALGLTPDRLAGVNQVHSASVVTIGADWSGWPGERPRADALVTDAPGVALTVLTADCQPILFADPRAGVIGAAHAGSRGTRAGVIEAAVAAMAALGARPARILAVIGPTIGPAAYEVGADFRDATLADDPAAAAFFTPGAPGHFQFDLPAYGLNRLARAGVTRARWTGHCTYSDPERFFSYRRTTHRAEADFGRLIAAIRL